MLIQDLQLGKHRECEQMGQRTDFLSIKVLLMSIKQEPLLLGLFGVLVSARRRVSVPQFDRSLNAPLVAGTAPCVELSNTILLHENSESCVRRTSRGSGGDYSAYWVRRWLASTANFSRFLDTKITCENSNGEGRATDFLR
jgi:hypothetical protein